MPDADISALVCSRICHDLISPVGAIGNGVELMREMQSPTGEELSLIAESATKAAATLQYYRLAFGAAAPGEAYGVAKCRKMALAYFEGRRAELNWDGAMGETTRASARLLANLLLVAAAALPRGGRVTVATRIDGGFHAEIRAAGPMVRFRSEAEALLSGEADEPPAPGDVHLLLARRGLAQCGATLTLRAGAEELALKLHIPQAA